MEWIRPLWSRIAVIPERTKNQDTDQLVGICTVVFGIMVLFGLLSDPIMSLAGDTIWANVAWIVVALAALVVMLWLCWQLFKRGYDNLRRYGA